MDLLNEVAEHIDGTVDDGLTGKKVCNRGRVLESTDEVIVFEVERHKRASGASYREGLPMDAFVTYWPCYRFDRESGELERLEERRPREFECSNYHGLAEEILRLGLELSVRPADKGWICTEQCGNAKREVKDLEGVKAFAERQVRNWDLESTYGPELKDVLPEEEFEEHFAKLEEALVEEAHRQAEDAWKYR